MNYRQDILIEYIAFMRMVKEIMFPTKKDMLSCKANWTARHMTRRSPKKLFQMLRHAGMHSDVVVA
jgi:hypothetical protein